MDRVIFSYFYHQYHKLFHHIPHGCDTQVVSGGDILLFICVFNGIARSYCRSVDVRDTRGLAVPYMQTGGFIFKDTMFAPLMERQMTV